MHVTAGGWYPLAPMLLFLLLVLNLHAEPRAWCPFCNGERVAGWNAAGRTDFLKSNYNPFPDAPILSTPNFVVYITKGAFTPHYFLLVSKAHYERIADLPPELLKELDQLKLFFADYYHNFLKTDYVAFEHGPLPGGHSGGGKGGCIEHLHLHILPYSRDGLRFSLDRRETLKRSWQIQSFAELKRFGDYIMIQEITGELFVFPVEGEIPSQTMRRLISAKLGIPELWNWREFINDGDFLLNSIETIKALARYRCDGLLNGKNFARLEGL